MEKILKNLGILLKVSLIFFILGSCAQPSLTQEDDNNSVENSNTGAVSENDETEIDLSHTLSDEQQAELVQEIIEELGQLGPANYEEVQSRGQYNKQSGGNSAIFTNYLVNKLVELIEYDHPLHWEANYNNQNDEASLGLGVRKDWVENVIRNFPTIYNYQTWYSNKRKRSGRLTRKKKLEVWVSNFRLDRLHINNNITTAEMVADIHVTYKSKPNKRWLTYVNERGTIRARLPIKIDPKTSEIAGGHFQLYDVKLNKSINPIVMIIFPGITSAIMYNILKNPIIKNIGNKKLSGEIFRKKLKFLEKIQEFGKDFNFAFEKLHEKTVGSKKYVMTYWTIGSIFDQMSNLTKSQASKKEIAEVSRIINSVVIPAGVGNYRSTTQYVTGDINGDKKSQSSGNTEARQ